MNERPGDSEKQDVQWEELSAYLDGELSPDERRRVESQLAGDPVYAAMLHKLERSWNALDALPKADTGQAFAQTTLQMVSIAAERESHRPNLVVRRTAGIVAFATAVLAAGLAGVFVGKQLYPDVNQGLLEDLPLMEHLDAYRQVESIEFLRQLNQMGVFEDEGDRAS